MKKVHQNFRCNICFELLDDTHQCSNGHMFCLGCISVWLRRHPKHASCPTCRIPLSQETLKRNLAVAYIINQLEVKCANSSTDDNGSSCDWQGSLERFKAHCDNDCGDLQVDCPNSTRGCTEKVLRRDSEAHRLECPHELVACVECDREVKRGDICEHLHTCPAVEVVCAHGCGVSHARRDAALHAEECPEALVACPYKEQGCAVEGLRRKDYAAHQEASMVTHMELLQEQQLRKNSEVEKLKNGFDCLQHAYALLSEDNVQLRKTIATLEQRATKLVQRETVPLKEESARLRAIEAALVMKQELLKSHLTSQVEELRHKQRLLEEFNITQVKLSWTFTLTEKKQSSKSIKTYLVGGYGKYNVGLQACRNNNNSLVVYVRVTSGEHYPVCLGGTEIACGNALRSVLQPSDQVCGSGSQKFGFHFLTWEEALSQRTVKGKITITADLKMKISDNAEPILV